MFALLFATAVLLLAAYRLLRPPRAVAVPPPLSSRASRLLAEADAGGACGPRVLLMYGTEYGFAREVCARAASVLGEMGFCARVVGMRDWSCVRLEGERFLGVVCSTTGDGVVPTDARGFAGFLEEGEVGEGVSFGVLGLGDRGYPHFCRGGRIFDDLLGKVGNKIVDMGEVDQEDWEVVEEWVCAFGEALRKRSLEGEEEEEEDYLPEAVRKYVESIGDEGEKKIYSRIDPFMADIVARTLLTLPGADRDAKEVVRVEFDVEGSGIEYTVGDALGVVPKNNSNHVIRLLQALASNGDERVCLDGEYLSFEDALTDKLDIRTIRPDLIALLGRNAKDPAEVALATKLLGCDPSTPPAAHVLSLTDAGKEYVQQREVFDILSDFVSTPVRAEDMARLLRPLHARYYSISSTPVTDPRHVAITVDVLRYSSLHQEREGVASTFLMDRCRLNMTQVGLFVSRNDNFRLPLDPSKPVIMIGPGTGIAPFIGFIEERAAKKASGGNVLFSGCRHEHQDFLYRSELKKYVADGMLQLHTAFSRDQKHKVYVQHRMAKHSENLWRLIEKDGAHIYVCGDGGRMATDVDTALRDIVREHGRMSEAQVEEYMTALSNAKRYQRDVWVT